MKKKMLAAIFLLSSICTFAQKQISSVELISAINEGKSLNYENVIIVGDIDLSDSGENTPAGQYPEGDKTAYIFTNFIKQPVSFKNCTFKGQLTMFKKEESANKIKEYRVEFLEEVTFQNCKFEKVVNFELTNFNKVVSFKGAVFKEQPRFVRMGLYQKPNIQGLALEKGCVFQFDQSKKEKIFTSQELAKVIDTM